MHPLTADNLSKGAFISMIVDLSCDETKFSNYFHMDIFSFDELRARIDGAKSIAGEGRVYNQRCTVESRSKFAMGSMHTHTHTHTSV